MAKSIVENYFFSSTPEADSDTPATTQRLDDLEVKQKSCSTGGDVETPPDNVVSKSAQ